MSEPRAPGLDSLRERIEANIAATPPDFADVLARMHARSDDLLPGAQASASLDAEAEVAIPADDEAVRELLAPACTVLRERIEASLSEADMRPLPTPSSSTTRTRVWIGAGLLLAAAALALAFVAPRLSTRVSVDQRSSLSVDERLAGQGGLASPRPSAGAVERMPAQAQASEPGAPVEAGEDAEPEPVDPTPTQPEAKRPKVPLSERLDALDREAQTRWQKGDRAGAAKLYRKLIDLGGKHPKVELAYAELFALTRARAGDLAPHWRKYLRRFPQGRYAREAKAGLCRQTPADEREACWSEYEETFGPR